MLDEYSDWEGAFLSTALHNGIVPGGEVKYKVHVVAPTLNAVRSIGGFRTSPDYSFENMPKKYEALILIGDNRWGRPKQSWSFHWCKRLSIVESWWERYAVVHHSYVLMAF